mmetsp:Transcript_19438/g.54144  ORF Transcript_19438/g.54144 Transcript_19438/m.54144 type:complete len:288 (+) Transcript_19438:1266-2129(+)
MNRNAVGLLDMVRLSIRLEFNVEFFVRKNSKLFVRETFKQWLVFGKDFEQLGLLVRRKMFLARNQFTKVGFLIFGGTINLGLIGVGFSNRVGLIADDFPDQGFVNEVGSWMKGHLLVKPGDEGGFKIHFDGKLFHSDAPNNQIITHVINQEASHLFDASGIREFWKHNVSKHNIFSTDKLAIWSSHCEWSFKNMDRSVFWNLIFGEHFKGGATVKQSLEEEFAGDIIDGFASSQGSRSQIRNFSWVGNELFKWLRYWFWRTWRHNNGWIVGFCWNVKYFGHGSFRRN